MVAELLVRPLVQHFAAFFRREAAGGVVLMISAVLANVDWGPARYFPAIWDQHLRLALHGYVLDHTLLQGINDGLMTVFFLIVGLEIKREVLDGELAPPRQTALPIAGALGGMLLPALLFTVFNHGTPTAGGWGIPTPPTLPLP